jgi:hypothetical protein
MAEVASDRAPVVARRIDAPLALVWAVIGLTTVLRFTVGASAPLWMDEAWTGMLIRQPSFGLFLHQTFSDTNAPLYPFVAAAFGLVAGYSDAALRLPAALFGALTPLAALRMPLPGPRSARLLWTVLLACWIPGIWYSQDARCYTLLILLATLNVPLFARLIEAPSRARFAQWAGAAALMILTHYYAGLLVGLQAVAFAVLRRRRLAVALPGLLLFLPAAAAMAVSAPKFLQFSDGAVSWIPLVRWSNLYQLASHVTGGEATPVALILWFLACVVGRRATDGRRPWRIRAPVEIPPVLKATAYASAAAACLALLAGAVKPVVYENYLAPFAPGVLLGLACFAAAFFDLPRFAPALLSGLYLATTLLWAIVFWRGDWPFEIETASGWLMRHQPARVVFLWDSEFMLNLARRTHNFEAIAGSQQFFFDRAGARIPVEAIDVRPGQDPNAVLLRASETPGTAIVWVYDTNVVGANAKRFPPVIQRSPRLACRDFGRRSIGVVACHAR